MQLVEEVVEKVSIFFHTITVVVSIFLPLTVKILHIFTVLVSIFLHTTVKIVHTFTVVVLSFLHTFTVVVSIFLPLTVKILHTTTMFIVGLMMGLIIRFGSKGMLHVGFIIKRQSDGSRWGRYGWYFG